MDRLFWITRPKKQAIETERELRDCGLECYILPLIHVICIDEKIEDKGYEWIVITSRNAIHTIENNPWMIDRKYFIVGERLRKNLIHIGVQNIQIVEENVKNLKGKLKLFIPHKKTLYISGSNITEDFADIYQNPFYQRQIVYKTKYKDSLTKDQINIINNKVTDITVFSKNTMACLEKLDNKYNLNIELKKLHFSMSNTKSEI